MFGECTHTIPLLKDLSRLLCCEEQELQERLNHPMVFQRVNNYLEGKRMKTSYQDRNGEFKEFIFSRLSLKSSLEQYAYEGYLGVNIAQHFYCKFRIRLQYPRMKCAIEACRKGNKRYYPLELLEIFHEGDKENCLDCAGKFSAFPKDWSTATASGPDLIWCKCAVKSKF